MLEARGLRSEVGGRELFADLSFEVASGEILAVVGPSGSGKTTLLRAVAGLTPNAGGELLLRGRPRQSWGPRAWRARVALVPQEPPPVVGRLLDFAERIAELGVIRERIDKATLLSDLQCHLEALDLHAGQLAQPFSELSGGERARSYLALILATQPEILLLDEPTAALDPATKGLVEARLCGRTALWVTHDLGQIERLGASALELFR